MTGDRLDEDAFEQDDDLLNDDLLNDEEFVLEFSDEGGEHDAIVGDISRLVSFGADGDEDAPDAAAAGIDATADDGVDADLFGSASIQSTFLEHSEPASAFDTPGEFEGPEPAEPACDAVASAPPSFSIDPADAGAAADAAAFEQEIGAESIDDLFGTSADFQDEDDFAMDFGAAVELGSDDDDLLDLPASDSVLDVQRIESEPSAAGLTDHADDVLFSDRRDDVAPQSDFGADLGPSFGHNPEYQMPDIDFETGPAPESREPSDASANPTDPFEVEVDLSAEDLSRDHFLDAEEGDDWRTLNDADAEADFAFDATPEPASLVDDGGDAFGFDDAEDPWAAAEGDAQDDYDPIYGDAVAGVADTADGEEFEPQFAGDDYAHAEAAQDYAEYEATYARAAPAGSEVVGAYAEAPPRSAWRWVAGIAALLPIAIAGVVVAVKPDWILRFVDQRRSVQPPALVDRTAIARPNFELQVTPPAIVVAAAVPEIDPTPPVEDPVPPKDPAVVIEPPQSDDPADVQPHVAIEDPATIVEPPLDPSANDPVATDDPPVEVPPVVAEGPGPTDPTPTQTVEPVIADPPPVVIEVPVTEDPVVTDDAWKSEFMAAGDLLIASSVASVPPDLPPQAAGLRLGRTAFVQLHNGAFFTGPVKRLEPTSISIEQAAGVLTFEYAELETLSPLASADLSRVTAGRNGFVRLHNQARLFGALLQNPDNSVTLSGPAGTVTVPEWQIRRIGSEAPGGVEIVEDSEDEWLRRRAHQRMSKPR